MLKNPRHETFCQEYVKNGGNAAEAYRIAYPRSVKWEDQSVWANASELLKNTKVLLRVEEIREELRKLYVDIDKEILEVYVKALRYGDVADFQETVDGKVKTRTMSRSEAAKGLREMLGLDKPKQTECKVAIDKKDNRTREEKIANIERLQKSRMKK